MLVFLRTDGRVLDLVDMRSRTKPSSLKEIGSPNPRCEESDTETWETAPLGEFYMLAPVYACHH